MFKYTHEVVYYKLEARCPRFKINDCPDSLYQIKKEDIDTTIVVFCPTCGEKFEVFVDPENVFVEIITVNKKYPLHPTIEEVKLTNLL